MLRLSITTAALACGAAAFSVPVFSAVTISRQPTQNVNCVAGVCTATAATAILNVTALRNLLASSSVEVSSGSDAQDIVFAVPFGWTSANTLTLDANRSIEIDRPLADRGVGALTLITNDGGGDGTLFFGQKGSVSFASTSNALTINNNLYRLANSIAQLAANIASHPHGFHAVANSYDASADGNYSRVPIQTDFGGTLEGLGNAISNFSLYDTVDNNVALFASLKKAGVLRNVRLVNVNIFSENNFVQFLAPLVAYNAGTVLQCQATGAIRSDFRVTGGGLVALSYGTIQRSFADVYVSGAQDAEVGGLVGNAHGTLSDVYATGRVIAGDRSDVGGLIGYFIGRKVTHAYATGGVSGGQNALVGGLMGENRTDASGGSVVHCYWDVVTSGTSTGAGYGDVSGISGLSTEQLQSGVPHDFDLTVWDEKKSTNGGLPYLIANPPL
jgi:hypothetical protein